MTSGGTAPSGPAVGVDFSAARAGRGTATGTCRRHPACGGDCTGGRACGAGRCGRARAVLHGRHDPAEAVDPSWRPLHDALRRPAAAARPDRARAPGARQRRPGGRVDHVPGARRAGAVRAVRRGRPARGAAAADRRDAALAAVGDRAVAAVVRRPARPGPGARRATRRPPRWPALLVDEHLAPLVAAVRAQVPVVGAAALGERGLGGGEREAAAGGAAPGRGRAGGRGGGAAAGARAAGRHGRAAAAAPAPDRAWTFRRRTLLPLLPACAERRRCAATACCTRRP